MVLASQAWLVAASGDELEREETRAEVRDLVCFLSCMEARSGQDRDTRFREARVVTLIHGLDGGGRRTFVEAGKVMGCGVERARQLYAGALHDLGKLYRRAQK